MKRINYIVFFVLLTHVTVAQDPIFSQFFQAPLYLNPGFTGLTPQQRLVLNNRIQWPGLPQAFTTYALSYDVRLDELNSGLGALLTTDRIGSANWYTTNLTLFYSYSIRLSKKMVLSPGASYGYGINGLDRTKLILGDEIEFNSGGQVQSLDPALSRLGNDQYADFSSGLVLYTKVWWVGLSFNHINQPNLSIINTVTHLPMKITFTTGARLAIKSKRKVDKHTYLTPSFIFQKQATFTQLTIGVNYHIDPIFIGVSYRGKPYEKNQLGLASQDAMIFQFGLLFKNFVFSYSYDFNVSALANVSGGAHEVAVSYVFQTKLSVPKNKKRSGIIPCPTGVQKSGLFK